ncbi:MAG: hypothetical protein K6F99_11430 [Lachnospiraceae bacterium]|nr:hypothetical protein [Lachnospiraceae bacterium]
MKQIILKTLTFIVVFTVSLFIMLNMINSTTNTEMTGNTEEASLPLVYINNNGSKINLMRGNTGNIQVSSVRGPLTVLDESREVDIIVDTFGEDVEELSYEVRSIDGGRLVEDTHISEFEKHGNELHAGIKIKDLISPCTEYMLIVVVGEADKTASYFTRIIYGVDWHEQEILNFVTDFCRTTFDKESATNLTTYLESNAMGDNSSFEHVTINSSFEQVTWGNLNVKAPKVINPSIVDMDGYTAALGIDYEVDFSGNHYYVNEYYRVRYTEKRIYLLDYRRDMKELFLPTEERFANDKIILGIRDENVNMQESSDGKNLAFEQNGTLYSFRWSDKRLALVHSFYNEDDIRTGFEGSRVKILRVGENGSIYYAVYGYMTRGRHEGDTGISVCYYDSALNQTEEMVYIPYRWSYDRLFNDVDTLFYFDGGSYINTYLGGGLYKINIDNRSIEEIATPLDIVVSASQRMTAIYEGSGIKILDFYAGNTREMTEEGVRALGFIGEDFVYGVVGSADVKRSIFGSDFEVMSTVYIVDKNGDEIKRYSKPDVYVTGAEINENEIKLKCISFAGDRIIDLPDEDIMHNKSPEATKCSVLRVATEDMETVTEIGLPQKMSGSLQLVTPKTVLYTDNRDTAITERTLEGSFYTYIQGKLAGRYINPVEAIMDANKGSGVVVDDHNNYIWRKGKKDITDIADISDTDGMNLAIALNTVLSHVGVSIDSSPLLARGDTAIEILSDNIDGCVMSLKGCDLSEMQFFISEDCPVLAVYQGEPVILKGYDPDNITVIGANGQTEKMSMSIAAEMFESSGNDYLAYVNYVSD